MPNTVEILLLAQDAASGVFGEVGKSIGGLGIALSGLAIGAVAGFGAVLGDSVKAAMDAQNADAQLDAVLKSTSVAFGDAAAKTVFHATATGTATQVIALSTKEHNKLNKELDAAPAKLQTATARLHDMQAAYAAHKTHTESSTLALQRQGETVASLTALIQTHGEKTHQVTTATAGYWEKVPGALQITKKAVLDLATGLADTTRISRENALVGENMLLTFTQIGKDTFPAATNAVADMATAMSGGLVPTASLLKDTAIQVGKALNDPVKGIAALHRVGVAFTDQQKEQIKTMVKAGDTAGAQAVILKELQTEFGGSAKAAGQTFAGQLDIMNHRLEEAKVAIGTALLPVLGKLMDVMGPLVTSVLQQFADWFASPAVTFGLNAVGEAIKSVATALSTFLASLQSGKSLSDTFGAFAVSILEAFGMGQDAAVEFGNTIGEVISRIVGFFDALKKGIDVGNPFAGLAGGIQTLGSPFDGLAKLVGHVGDAFNSVIKLVVAEWPKIRDTVVGVFNQIVAAVTPIINQIASIVTTVLGIVIGAVQEHGAAIMSNLQTAWNAVAKAVTIEIDSIARIVRTVFNAVAEFLRIHGAEIQTFLGGAWEKISSIIANAAQLLPAIVQGIFGGIADFVSNNQQGLLSTIEFVWSIIKLMISNTLDLIGGIVNVALKLLQGDWSGAWDAIKETVTNIWGNILEFFNGVPRQMLEAGIKTIAGFIQGLVDTGKQIGPQIAALATSIGTWIVTNAPIIGGKISAWATAFLTWITTDVIPFIGAQITALATTVGTWITTNASKAGANISLWAGKLLNWIVTDVIPFIGTHITALATSIGTWVTTNAPKVGATISDWAGKLLNWITTDVIPFVGNKIGELATTISTWVTTKASDIGKSISAWATKFLTWVQTDVIPTLPAKMEAIGVAIGTWIGKTIIELPKQIAKIGDLFGAWIVGVVKELPGKLEAIGTAIGTWLTGAVSAVSPRISDLADKFKTWIEKEVVPELPEKLAAIGTAIGVWIGTAILNLPKELTKIGNLFGAWIVNDAVPAIIENFPKFIGALNDAVTGLGKAGAGIVAGVAGALALVGKGIIAGIIAGVKPEADKVQTRLKEIISDGAKWLQTEAGLAGDLLNAGKSIIAGLLAGLKADATKISEFLMSLVNDAIKKIKDLLHISSPSGVFHDIGMNMMLGLAQGIASSADLPQAQFQGVIGGLSMPSGAAASLPAPATMPSYAGPSTNQQATVNVYLDGHLIGTALGSILYNELSLRYGGNS